MLKGIVYGFVGVGAVGALSICELCKPPALSAAGVTPAAFVTASTTSADSVGLSTVALKIEGMTCGGCVVATRAVLTRLNGVSRADVSYERGRAVVTYNPLTVTVEQIIAAVKTLGYTATVVTG